MSVQTCMRIELGAVDGGHRVTLSAVARVADHERTKVLSANVYDDERSAWRAIRELASNRVAEGVEEQIVRPEPAAPPSKPIAHPDAPF
jgi:hypothetical protein